MIVTATSDFLSALPARGRLLGLDVGTRTIGTALCDAGWSFASPAHLIKRTKFTADKAELATLIAQQQVKGLVIGLPLNLDGSDSPRTQSTRAFARNMAELELPIFLWCRYSPIFLLISPAPTHRKMSLLRQIGAQWRSLPEWMPGERQEGLRHDK